jgi:hypothetical protein
MDTDEDRLGARESPLSPQFISFGIALRVRDILERLDV